MMVAAIAALPVVKRHRIGIGVTMMLSLNMRMSMSSICNVAATMTEVGRFSKIVFSDEK